MAPHPATNPTRPARRAMIINVAGRCMGAAENNEISYRGKRGELVGSARRADRNGMFTGRITGGRTACRANQTSAAAARRPYQFGGGRSRLLLQLITDYFF